jgi:hypothetical protein
MVWQPLQYNYPRSVHLAILRKAATLALAGGFRNTGGSVAIDCFECGGVASHNHHVVPKSRGGTRTIPLCVKCHSKAHGRKMAHDQLTRDALAHKKAKGERTGTVPFGYDLAADGVALVPNAAQLEAVAIIQSLRDSGMTLRAIADELTARCIPTAKGNSKWTHTAVQSVIARGK